MSWIVRWVGLSGFCAVTVLHGAVFQMGTNGQPMRWNLDFYDASLFPDQNPKTLAIRYHLAAEGWSVANRTNELNAIRAAFDQWQSIPGVRFRFEEASLVQGVTDISVQDGRNTVVWLSANRMINGGLTFFPSSSRAITVLAGTGTDEIIAEADIVLNRDQPWFTEFDPDRTMGTHVESVVLHEVGHLLGLNHAALGGATMFWQGPMGISSTTGLSQDEISGARSVYPSSSTAFGKISGVVSLNSSGLKGAVVVAEDLQGRVVAAVMSRDAGAYEMAGLSPGDYRLRVTPLDPSGASSDSYLVRGADLDTTSRFEFNTVATDFLPSTNTSVAVVAGKSSNVQLMVKPGVPPFRISETRRFLLPEGLSSGDECIQLRPGQTNAWVAVYVPGLSSGPATLRMTGVGVDYGVTEIAPKVLRQLTRVQVPVSVSPDALPGLRSLSLTVNGYTAWANGFVEILPATYDLNFDGLDDLFQRKYFSPFTRPEAAPAADPDGDGFSNMREAAAGSDPTNAQSFRYRILSVKQTLSGTLVTWESAAGRKYKISSRSRLDNATWEIVAPSVMASGETGEWQDTRPSTETRFYRVEDAP